MTYTITEHPSEFNIYDIFDILNDYVIPRPGLDEEGYNFIENLPNMTNSPSWRMVVGYLNRHIFVNASGEYTLRLSLFIEDENECNKKKITRPFILTQSSNITDLVKWVKYAGNRKMTFNDIVGEMNRRYGGQIRLGAKNEHHNVASLVNIIEEGRIQNFDNLYRYISIVAPNVKFKIIAMQSNKQRKYSISEDFCMSWNTDFTSDVKVFSGGRMTPYMFTDDENEIIDEESVELPKSTKYESLKGFRYDPSKKDKQDNLCWKNLKNNSEIKNWINDGLLKNNLKPTDKFFSSIIKGEIKYNPEN